ncbi:MAG: glutathione peroxidase [Gammaproteobacteria bacterium RIFCSPLOWO2_02_FULL_57_10]|nr:MAG: glutathione peroxidase [Gammaproteobacteria bacterium RIFCSPLOWO2_02_FULL_57_10]
MKTLTSLLAVLTALLAFAMPASAQDAACAQWLEHEVTKLNSSDTVDLCAETAGKPVLLVNTASYCGFTYQFTALEALFQRFKDEGLVVIGFPSDDFNQEDDNAAATAEICYVNHGVTFPMTEVVKVKNADAHPVFAHLGSETEAPGWNFNKYLVGKDGEVLVHFGSNVEPDAPEMIAAIEAAL